MWFAGLTQIYQSRRRHNVLKDWTRYLFPYKWLENWLSWPVMFVKIINDFFLSVSVSWMTNMQFCPNYIVFPDDVYYREFINFIYFFHYSWEWKQQKCIWRCGFGRMTDFCYSKSVWPNLKLNNKWRVIPRLIGWVLGYSKLEFGWKNQVVKWRLQNRFMQFVIHSWYARYWCRSLERATSSTFRNRVGASLSLLFATYWKTLYIGIGLGNLQRLVQNDP